MSNASIRMLQSATGPSTPPSGYSTLWASTDDNFYVTKDTGTTVGLQGTSGTSGVAGVTGAAGTSGTSGTSGTTGAVGPAGVSGTSGTSGLDGAGGATGYYGSFYSSSDQPIATPLTAQKVTLGNTALSYRISESLGTITIEKAGTYALVFNGLVSNLSGNVEDVTFWLKYQGSDYPNSSHTFTIAARKSVGVPTERLVSFEFLGKTLGVNETVEVYWQATSTDVSLQAKTNIGIPNSASCWINITQIAYNGGDGTSGTSGTSPVIAGTTTTAVAIPSPGQVFGGAIFGATTQPNYAVGQIFRYQDTTDPTKYFIGRITNSGYSNPSAWCAVALQSGSAGSTISNNRYYIAGLDGTSGTSGVSITGATGAAGTSGTSGVSPADPGLIAGSGTNSMESSAALSVVGADASGACAIAIGDTTVATQCYTMVIGNCSWACGYNSIVIGHNSCSGTFNGGTRAVVIGNNQRGGDQVVAIGLDNSIDADRSVGIGASLLSGGLFGVNIGYANSMNDFSFSKVGIGCANTIGQSSCAIAIGDTNTVCSSVCFSGAIGSSNTVSHSCSMVIGNLLSSVVDGHTHLNALYIQTTPTYADNAAALSAGLTGGQVYRTSTGTLQIVY